MRVIQWLRKGVRIRLSVRALMVLVLVLGLWLGWAVRRARIQREVIRAIGQNGSVEYEWQYVGEEYHPELEPPGPKWWTRLKKRLGYEYFDVATRAYVFGENVDLAQVERLYWLEWLHVSGDFENVSLKHLEGLKRLKHLELQQDVIHRSGGFSGYGATIRLAPDDLKHVECLTQLQELDLMGIRIEDEDLEIFSKLTRLKSLTLENTAISDQGIEHLMALRELETLSLGETTVTKAGLERLGRLSKLKVLKLISPDIESLKPISHLVGLRKLWIPLAPLNDEGLAPLSRFKELECLDLRGARISDDGLPYIYGLKPLRLLNLDGTRVTDAGVAELRRHLPSLIVDR